MNKINKFLTVVLILIICSPIAYSQSISLDNVVGLNGDGHIPVDGGTVTFNIRLTGDATSHTGMANGFRVYSPDGATWTATVPDTANLGWEDMFDLIYAINTFSLDGALADTIGFGGATLFGSGIAAGFDEVSYMITVGPFDEADRGKTLVLDSSFYRPTGVWKWAGPDAFPSWDGPHEYLVDPPDVSDELIVTPDTLFFEMLSNFDSVMTAPFSVASSGNNFDFNVSESSPWISLSATSSTTPDDITVEITNPGPEGVYTANVEVSSVQAINSPQFVVVQVTVIEPLKYLLIDPTELNFAAQVGHGDPDAQYVQITELNNYNIVYEAQNNDSWISLIDSIGTTPDSTGVQVLIDGLAPGQYVDTVYYDYNEDPQDGTMFYTLVTLDVTPNSVPQLDLSETSFTIDECATLEIPFSATDNDGDMLVAWIDPAYTNMTVNQPVNGNGLVVFNPSLDQAGVYAPTLYLSDGIDTVFIELSIIVEECEVEFLPKAVMQPDPLFAFFVDAVEPMTASMYFGDFETGHTAADVDFSTVVIDGSIIPSANSVVPAPEGFFADVVLSEFDLNSYLEPLIPFFDTTMQAFTVSGQFNDATPFSISGEVILRGHLSGDFNLDGVRDIEDVVLTVNYMFLGGPAPQYIESLDLNRDGVVDIMDMVLFIEIFFNP